MITYGQADPSFGAFATALVVLAVTVVAIGIAVLVNRRRSADRAEARWRTQAWAVGLAIAGLLTATLTLPTETVDKSTLLSVFGIGLTAILALSATTVVSNATAGLVLHVVGNFRPGDFIRVSDHFGRVTERRLFHTELQTEDGDLTTLPNINLVTQAVTVVRATGTVISASVSLGYDVNRAKVEPVLLEAATSIGLAEPFVHITELGDFSVTYRIAGFLSEVKQILRLRSRLRASVLDALHAADIEIVSPTFMNQRPNDPTVPVIPAPVHSSAEPSDELPEKLVFDKAERAGRLEELKDRRAALETDLDDIRAALRTTEGDDRDRLERRAAATERLLDYIAGSIEAVRNETDV